MANKTKGERTALDFRQMLRKELNNDSSLKPHLVYLVGIIRILINLDITDEYLDPPTQTVNRIYVKDDWCLSECFTECGDYDTPAEIRYHGVLMAQTNDTNKKEWSVGQYVKDGINLMLNEETDDHV